MIIICFPEIGQENLATKYRDKINYLTAEEYINDKSLPSWQISFIESIKSSDMKYELTLIPYISDIVICLDALMMEYASIYPKDESIDNSPLISIFEKLRGEKLILSKDDSLEELLSRRYDWIQLDVINNISDTADNRLQIMDKNKLTLEELISDDVTITEADVRDLKVVQNKLKVGMLLQAKSSLNRILKLSKMLDRLYDELLDRIDKSLTTTDTASLSYTTEYIAKALNDTNQFIVSLINNEKVQNFFTIDNSQVINIHNDSSDVDKREKIRKAVEIVLDNIDYFEQGDFHKLKDPNIISVEGEDKNADL